MDLHRDRPLAQKQILCLLEGLINIHRAYLHRHPEAPLLYSSGCRYIGQEGAEDWYDYGEMLARGGGDCKILGAARIAELRERKGLGWQQVRPFLKWRRNKEKNFYLYHVQVRHNTPEGIIEIEDPSLKLGMREYHAARRDSGNDDYPELLP
ncbi:MAG: hypothetical protein WC763_07200 [Candidatus Paceibacterota bacterium]